MVLGAVVGTAREKTRFLRINFKNHLAVLITSFVFEGCYAGSVAFSVILAAIWVSGAYFKHKAKLLGQQYRVSFTFHSVRVSETCLSNRLLVYFQE